MIGLVTDSGAMMPAEFVGRFGVEVVPLTVRVNGTDHREGVDLDVDAFYGAWPEAASAVTVTQPSPGAFHAAYRRLAEAGATEVLSIHGSAGHPATVRSARTAAAASAVPVEVVDAGTQSFGIGCCVWEAALALDRGARLLETVELVEGFAERLSTAFILDTDRLAPDADVELPVYRMVGRGALEVIGSGSTPDALVTAMADGIGLDGRSIRVGVGYAGSSTLPVSAAIRERLGTRPDVAELVRYRLGPSIGVHSGPGIVCSYWYPALR